MKAIVSVFLSGETIHITADGLPDNEKIPFAEHQHWFNAFLADRRRFGFILEADGQPVAQVRFDPAELPGVYRIAISTRQITAVWVLAAVR
jgi:hypothetical protein